MKEIDLDTYKSAWKNYSSFQKKMLSDDEVYNFMHSESKFFDSILRKALNFDIAYKIVLTLSLLGISILFLGQQNILLFTGFLVLLSLLGVLFQRSVSRKFPDKLSQSLKSQLEGYIDFYHNKYVVSVYVGAFSNSLLFVTGSMYYIFFKYGKFQPFQIDDFGVLAIGIIVSFVVSKYAQTKNIDIHIEQLENILTEIDEETINETTLLEYRSRRFRIRLLLGFGLLGGLIILTFLALHIGM